MFAHCVSVSCANVEYSSKCVHNHPIRGYGEDGKLKGNELDLYTTQEPSHALAFDLFSDTWFSTVPHYGLGAAPHFEDGRIQWLERVCGGFAGKSVLELGPMEGGHTYMLSHGGASRVLAIEANSKAFLKCLLVQTR